MMPAKTWIQRRMSFIHSLVMGSIDFASENGEAQGGLQAQIRIRSCAGRILTLPPPRGFAIGAHDSARACFAARTTTQGHERSRALRWGVEIRPHARQKSEGLQAGSPAIQQVGNLRYFVDGLECFDFTTANPRLNETNM